MEAQPTKLVGSLGSKNRYFDFDKLAEVWFSFVKSLLSSSHKPFFFLRYLYLIKNIALSVQVTSIVTTNLNKIIDVNYYPVETAKRSNLRHRPIGIGVQGLADTFILLGMSFDSPEVKLLSSSVRFHRDLAKLCMSLISIVWYRLSSWTRISLRPYTTMHWKLPVN